MEKERTSQSNRHSLILYSVLAGIIVLSFLLFVPKVASTVFPMKRTMVWENFKSDTVKHGFDVQKFWEFREFYSPGYFTFNKTSSSAEIQKKLQAFGIQQPASFSTELFFHASHSSSLDTLTDETKLETILKGSNLTAEKMYYQTDSVKIFSQDANHVVITFLLPLSEMKKANGFFDYNEKDKELVKNKNWFNITKIDLP